MPEAAAAAVVKLASNHYAGANHSHSPSSAPT